MQTIRNEFLENQPKMIAILEDHRGYFEKPDEYEKSKKYILEFFSLIQAPESFKSEILDRTRVK